MAIVAVQPVSVCSRPGLPTTTNTGGLIRVGDLVLLLVRARVHSSLALSRGQPSTLPGSQTKPARRSLFL